MFTAFSYGLVVIVAVAIMVITDEDPTQVSNLEWLLFAVMLFAANELRKYLLKAYLRGYWE